MNNPESARENETHKILFDFLIHTDHLISARQLDLVIVNKKKIRRKVVFVVPVIHSEKPKESEKKDKYLDRARKLKKE